MMNETDKVVWITMLFVIVSIIYAVGITWWVSERYTSEKVTLTISFDMEFGVLEIGKSYNYTTPHKVTRTLMWEHNASFNLRDYLLVSFVPVKGGTRVHVHVREEIKEHMQKGDTLDFTFYMR